METYRRFIIAVVFTLFSFASQAQVLGIIASSYKPDTSTAKTALFNFNATAQSVSGTIDVSGTPSTAVVTATDPTTGWKVSSYEGGDNVTWVNFGPTTSSNTNGVTTDDGGGFAFGSAVGHSTWYTALTAFSNKIFIQVSNLDPAKTYTFEMLSSLSSSSGAPTNDTTKMLVMGNATSAFQSLYQVNNTSKTIKFTGIVPKSTGIINISLDASGTTGTKYAVINALKITEE